MCSLSLFSRAFCDVDVLLFFLYPLFLFRLILFRLLFLCFSVFFSLSLCYCPLLHLFFLLFVFPCLFFYLF